MNNDRWTQIETLVEQALALPPEDRAAFIETQCGEDETLRNEILSLLEHGDKALSFIGHFEEQVVVPSIDNLVRSQSEKDHRIDTLYGHYHITDILGRGGMGIVYKAKDKSLDRTVALKFLPSHLTRSDKDKQRFIREAKAAAALNHPNICTIHSVEQHDGQHFISMEYIDGQTLREKLESGEISSETALKYAIQIAEALAEAHEKGIVHRDIKPGNIMVDSKGRIKVMDFGLAQLQGGSRITKEGTTMGTVQYMSPEQVNGEQTDPRTDIWSFGVVLYEMLTGKCPFDGSNDQSVIYSILNEDPEPPISLRRDVPKKLERIILKALAKKPNTRYQHINMLKDLLKNQNSVLNSPFVGNKSISKLLIAGTTVVLFASVVGIWIFSGYSSFELNDSYETSSVIDINEPSLGQKSIAVLPFSYLSSEDSSDYLSSGMTDELLNRLAKIENMKVVGRQSVMQYQNSDKSIPEIAQELGVAYILEGSLLLVDNQIRVHTQLIDGSNGTQQWAENYTYTLRNILELQRIVTQQVVQKLEIELLPEESEQLSQSRQVNEEAYELYLRAQHQLSRRWGPSINKSIQLFKESIAIDSTFAPAHGGLAMAIFWSGLAADADKKKEIASEALDISSQALDLDPSLVNAHLMKAIVYVLDRDKWEQSAQAFKDLLRLNPNVSEVQREYGWYLLRLGQVDEAIMHMELAAQLNPRTWIPYTSLGYAYYCNHQYVKAIEELEVAVDLGGSGRTLNNLRLALIKRGQQLIQNGRTNEAESIINRLKKLLTEFGLPESALTLDEHLIRKEKKKIIEYFNDVDSYPFIKAVNLLLAGESDQSLQLMDEVNHTYNTPAYVDPMFDPIRNNPRFEEMVKRGLGRDIDLR